MHSEVMKALGGGKSVKKGTRGRYLGELEERTHSFLHFTEPLCVKGVVTMLMAGKQE